MRRTDLEVGRDYLFSPDANWAHRAPGDRADLVQSVRRARLLDASLSYIDLRGRPGADPRPKPSPLVLPDGESVLALAAVGQGPRNDLVLIQFVDPASGDLPENPQHIPAWAVKLGKLRGEWAASIAVQHRNYGGSNVHGR